MWPAESIMQSMRPAMLCRFPTPALTDINTQFVQLNNTFSHVVNRHAPLRPVTRTERRIKQKPWLTKGLLNSINLKNKMLKSFIYKKDQNA